MCTWCVYLGLTGTDMLLLGGGNVGVQGSLPQYIQLAAGALLISCCFTAYMS
jgi:hypothetical protein